MKRALCLAVILAFATDALAGPGRPAYVPSAAATAIPAMTPAASAAVRRGLSIERWWTVFGDAALDALMAEALEKNEDMELALARVREAQASLDVARAAQSPTVDSQVGLSRQRKSEVGATPLPRGMNNPSSSLAPSLSAGYEVDLWDKLSSATAAARHQFLATEWARATVEWGITARLAEAYFGLAALDRQFEISEAVLKSREDTLGLRQREFAAGAGTELDLRRAEAEVTGTRASIASIARQRAALEKSLVLLLGRTPAEVASGKLARRVMDESDLGAAVLPEGDAAQLLVRRPDLRQAEAQLAASNSSIEAARAATLPSLRLTGTLGNDVRSIGDLFSPAALVWSLAASIATPIVDGGKLKAKVKEEEARAQQALASYRKSVVTAVAEVREAYESLDYAHEGLQAQSARVSALARARMLAQLGYDNGALPQIDLLDAERNWHQARLDQVSARRDRVLAQVSAFKALGGGYAPGKELMGGIK